MTIEYSMRMPSYTLRMRRSTNKDLWVALLPEQHDSLLGKPRTRYQAVKQAVEGMVFGITRAAHLHADANLGRSKANPGCLSHGCHHSIYQVLQLSSAEHVVRNSLCSLRHHIRLK